MSKDKILEEIVKENIFNKKSYFLDIDTLINENLLTRMSDVAGVTINELPTKKHQLIFIYKSNIFDGDEIIIEKYLHPLA